MIYNIALVFEERINKQIHDFYGIIKDNLNLEFGLESRSIPHATLIKFESKEELNSEKLSSIIEDMADDIKVDFSGITLLPSKSSIDCWVELSILKSQKLIEIQRVLISKLKDYDIVSGINDRFRPHITFCKTKNCEFNIMNLDSSLLRRGGVNARLVIGGVDSNFEFFEIR
ncbi:hypothetical protein KAT36_02340 [Candidatus Pacearchaeota archaeon]|nr:hypothetical protein [Candidatus Pacearchaeota archaeon]